jgi:hypothetical protein
MAIKEVLDELSWTVAMLVAVWAVPDRHWIMCDKSLLYGRSLEAILANCRELVSF